tara:strand:- start:502 stop:753 length:252 start_codon:yes stop_codon:yes gene_type:complete
MSRSTPIPFFANPPREYEQAYFSQLVRNFSVFAQQTQVSGPLRATTLTLTDLPVFAGNASALAGGLANGTVYRTATGELRIVV